MKILYDIFLFLSAVHVYWVLGGRRVSGTVIPTKDDETMLSCGYFATGLFGFGLLVLIRDGPLNIHLLQWVGSYGLWVFSAIFVLSAIREFNDVGFFKRNNKTTFERKGTKHYSPLCLLIGLLLLILQWYA